MLVSIGISTVHALLMHAVMGILALIGLAFLVRWLIGHNEPKAATPGIRETRRTEQAAERELKHLERKRGSKL